MTFLWDREKIIEILLIEKTYKSEWTQKIQVTH